MFLKQAGWIEYTVIITYFVMLLIVGWVMRRMNNDASDYFRSGCRGTWYLVGASAFMGMFSAWTFTGAAGVAFDSGWSVAVIYLANTAGFLVNFICTAPWFRQLRSITGPEIIRKRFDAGTQQFYALFSVITQILFGALHLYGLALFSSAIFGFKIYSVIVVIGLVVLFYSLTGGSWAVMATDFLQSLILIPMTMLICFLCLQKTGGFGGFLDMIQTQGLAQEFQMINLPGRFTARQFTIAWAVALLFKNILTSNAMQSAPRYFSVKTGREARKAALFACILMGLGAILWVIPPMTARLLIADQVAAVNIAKPAEASFALISLALLPEGMIGLMVVVIFAATMSSMDTALNRNAGIITQDVYPAVCRLFRKEPVDMVRRLRIGQGASFCLGIGIIGLALYFAGHSGKGIFELMLNIGAMLGIPLTVPMMLCLFIKRVPRWAAVASVSAALVPSVLGFYKISVFGLTWNYQQQVFTNLIVGTAAFLITMPFWKKESPAYKEKVADFFTTMHTPVDFEKEVGRANDKAQLKVLGSFGVAASAFIMLLMLIPNPLAGRVAIVSVAAFIGVISGLMLWSSYRNPRSRSGLKCEPEPRNG